jgi:hypothetical protein
VLIARAPKRKIVGIFFFPDKDIIKTIIIDIAFA